MPKSKIKNLFIAIVLILVIDQCLGIVIPFFAKKQKRDKRIELLLNNKISSDIIILGSSRALNNYNPELINKITGRTCYNLGFSGSNIVFHEMVLDLILESKYKPKTIIYNIDDYGTLYSVNGIEFRKDLLLPFVENKLINTTICKELKKAYWASQICQAYKQNVNFSTAISFLVRGIENEDYKTNKIDSLGANLMVQRELDSIPNYIKHRKYPDPEKTNLEYMESFKNIQNKCLKNNIQLIICYPPLLMNPTPFLKPKIKALKSVKCKLYVADTLLRDPKFFFNPDHLNKDGANFFSKHVSNQILKLNN